jgi:N-acetylglucosamine-6-phosphate deacetylase
MGCMVNAVKTMGIPLETAVACATINPAKAIGEDARYGSIETGKKGNAVILDKNDLSVRAVIKNGEKI